jgi:hypothetical protein
MLVPNNQPHPAFEIDGKLYQVKMPLDPFSFLVTDGKQDYQYVNVPELLKDAVSGHPLGCQGVCRIPMRRVRRYCLRCPLKAVLYGKAPALRPVSLFTLVRVDDRPGAKWKNRILAKSIMPLAEELARH